MPLIKVGKNDISIIYKLPNRKSYLMTDSFLKDLKIELDKIFKIENGTYWTHYDQLGGCSGFDKALKIVCQKYNLSKAIYEYSRHMPWYDYDLFHSEIVELMLRKGIILEGKIEDMEHDYVNDADYELEMNIKKFKGYNVIIKDWVLTKEAKEKLGFIKKLP
jgi:hypothetical protein